MPTNDQALPESFALPSEQALKRYIDEAKFARLCIPRESLAIPKRGIPGPEFPRLGEMLDLHNKGVYSLAISHTLCRLIISQGIPDTPWLKMPERPREGIKHFPEFEPVHYVRKFWFGHFSEAYYLKLWSLGDSVIDLLNHRFSLDFINNSRLKERVMRWLKKERPHLHAVLSELIEDEVYREALAYRTGAAHGTPHSEIRERITHSKSVERDMPVLGPDGRPLRDEDGNLVMQKDTVDVVTIGFGEYTSVHTIMQNMDGVAGVFGNTIQELIALLQTEMTKPSSQQSN